MKNLIQERRWTCVVFLVAAGCSSPEPPAAAGAASADTAAAAPQSAEGPCALIALAEVQRAFPDSKPGRLDRRQEQQGVLTCVWEYSTGRFSITTSDEAPQPIMEEAAGWTLMFRDPLKPDAGRHVRYEEIAGVGDEAIAVVEPADASKGFIQGGEALQSFAALGAAVADRLK